MASIESIESIDVLSISNDINCDMTLRHRRPPHRAALEWQLVDCPTTGGQSSPHRSSCKSWHVLAIFRKMNWMKTEWTRVFYSIHTFWAFSLQSSDEALVSKRFWLVENPRFPKQTFYERHSNILIPWHKRNCQWLVNNYSGDLRSNQGYTLNITQQVSTQLAKTVLDSSWGHDKENEA